MGALAQETTPLITVKMDDISTEAIVVVIVGLIIIVTGLAILFAYTLLRSQDFPPPQALISALALLTFIALVAAIFSKSNALETIAATGVGAIAGAVSNKFTSRSDIYEEGYRPMGIEGIDDLKGGSEEEEVDPSEETVTEAPEEETEEVPQPAPTPAPPDPVVAGASYVPERQADGSENEQDEGVLGDDAEDDNEEN